MEITDLHVKLDRLRGSQYTESIALQQSQVELLEALRRGKIERA